ncbi:MAG: hypothetical protein LDL42_14185, partial [Rhizobium sp.]|nr:hypothetical protein [Rhizobium sp.]
RPREDRLGINACDGGKIGRSGVAKRDCHGNTGRKCMAQSSTASSALQAIEIGARPALKKEPGALAPGSPIALP